MSHPGNDMPQFDSELEQRVAHVAESLGWYARLEQRIGHSRYSADIILNNAQDFTGQHAVIEIKIGSTQDVSMLISHLWSVEHAVLRSLPENALFIPLLFGFMESPSIELIKFAFPHAVFSTLDNLDVDLDKSLKKIPADFGRGPDPMDFVNLDWLERIRSGSKSAVEFYSTLVAEGDIAIPIDRFVPYIQKYEKAAQLRQVNDWLNARGDKNMLQLSDYSLESVEHLSRLFEYRLQNILLVHGLPTYGNLELFTWLAARHPNVLLASWKQLKEDF